MRTVIRHVQVFDGTDVFPATDLSIDGDHIVGYESGRGDVEVAGTGRPALGTETSQRSADLRAAIRL
jgi:hypothetical protein